MVRDAGSAAAMMGALQHAATGDGGGKGERGGGGGNSVSAQPSPRSLQTALAPSLLRAARPFPTVKRCDWQTAWQTHTPAPPCLPGKADAARAAAWATLPCVHPLCSLGPAQSSLTPSWAL